MAETQCNLLKNGRESVQIKRYIVRVVPAEKTASGATESCAFNFTNGTAKDANGDPVIIPSGECIISGTVVTSGSTYLICRTFNISSARTVTVGISNVHPSSALQLTLDIEVFTISGPDVTVTW